MYRLTLLALVMSFLPTILRAEISVQVVYLQLDVPPPPVLSNLVPIPEDLGRAGAELGLADNLTTAKFLGHEYQLDVKTVPEDGNWEEAAKEALQTSSFLLLDAPAEAQLRVADLPEAEGALLFNVSAPDTDLRDASCRPNMFHTGPSYQMRTDALAQFLVKRRWTTVALIEGEYAPDSAFATSLRRSIDKFNLALKAEKTWVFDADMRRNAAQEVPLFTQEFGDYDTLLIADETGDFARYIAFNTWEARPVAGSAGLQPLAWSHVVEQWGAVQMQNRFEEAAGRDMQSRDYAAWAAMRALGEAVTRTNASDPESLRAYLLSEAFELAGFKGRAMDFRAWNGQLRQPIPLVTDSAVVAMAPLEGFLHRTSELDTLGLDQPETNCTAFLE